MLGGYPQNACILFRMRLAFENQPLTEVSLITVLERELELSIELIYELGKEAEKHGILIASPDRILTQIGTVKQLGAVSGVKFLLGKGVSVQIQPDLVWCSWIGANSAGYPKFPALLSAVETIRELVFTVKGEELLYDSVILEYHNYIRVSPGESISDYFQNQVSSAFQASSLTLLNQAWSENEVDFQIQTRKRPEDDAYDLVTTAAMARSTATGALSEPLILNAKLNEMFSRLISNQTKIKWGAVEG
jgi:hypothetical protein